MNVKSHYIIYFCYRIVAASRYCLIKLFFFFKTKHSLAGCTDGAEVAEYFKRRQEEALTWKHCNCSLCQKYETCCCAFQPGIKLTWQTNWAHITDLNEITVAETCSSVVHVCRRWQHQLRTLLRVWQEHPLFRKHYHQHKAGPSTER